MTAIRIVRGRRVLGRGTTLLCVTGQVICGSSRVSSTRHSPPQILASSASRRAFSALASFASRLAAIFTVFAQEIPRLVADNSCLVRFRGRDYSSGYQLRMEEKPAFSGTLRHGTAVA